MRISGIGSRQTPPKVLHEMTAIGDWARKNGHQVFSGGAEGADKAFETGALKNCKVFLPWASFNAELPMLGVPAVIKAREDFDFFVRRFHPAPDNLSRGAFALMRRNACQVLGENLNDPVRAVVCWADPKKEGGTGQALRIAREFKIEVLNMAESQFSSCAAVVSRLEALTQEEDQTARVADEVRKMLREEFPSLDFLAVKQKPVSLADLPKTMIRKKV